MSVSKFGSWVALLAVAVAGVLVVEFGRQVPDDAAEFVSPSPVAVVVEPPEQPTAVVVTAVPTAFVVNLDGAREAWLHAIETAPTTDPTAAPVPTAVAVVFPETPEPAGCDQAIPAFDNPTITWDGTPVWQYERIIWSTGQSFWCDGWRWLAIARCEGFNAFNNNYDPGKLSGSGDVGFFQINQIHGHLGGLIAGQWPYSVDTPTENLAIAVKLRNQQGLSPWANSRHCWNK